MRLSTRHSMFAALTVAGASSIIGCTDSAQLTEPGVLPPSFSRTPNITIDGALGPGEWGGAATAVFAASGPSGPVGVRVSVTHDETYLYLAAAITRRDAFSFNDGVAFEFSNDNSGVAQEGDDIVIGSASAGVIAAGDWYRYDCEQATEPAGCNQSDVHGGGTNDVLFGFGTQTLGPFTTGAFEWRKELDSSDDDHDFSIVPPQTVGMFVQVSLYDTSSDSYLHTFYPGFRVYCALTIGLASATSLSC